VTGSPVPVPVPVPAGSSSGPNGVVNSGGSPGGSGGAGGANGAQPVFFAGAPKMSGQSAFALATAGGLAMVFGRALF
jgi:hypothetical protein